jgi:hypothetical protein
MVRRKENCQPLPREPGWRDIRDELCEEVNGYSPAPRPEKGLDGRPPADLPRVIIRYPRVR